MIDTDLEQKLNRYLDGEMDADECAAFERAIESDPALQAQVERMAATDTLLRQAMDEAVPDELDPTTLARFGLADGDQSNVLPLPRRVANDNPPTWRRWGVVAGGAIAAALAIMLVIPRGSEEPWRGEAFGSALDSTASLQVASLPDGGRLTPRLSFQAADGRYCREFALRTQDAALSRDGIACRARNGEWKAEALVEPKPEAPVGSDIELAGGDDNPALDSAYDRLGGSAPLGPAAERSLIARDWQKAR